jgi:hypothetical protein
MLPKDGPSIMNKEMNHDIHVASFRNGDHICFFYQDATEQIATAGPFVKLGLQRGERCLCVLPKDRTDSLFSWLDAHAIDADTETARGALMLATPEESYLQGGTFDRSQMVGLLDSAMRQSLRLGFTGFRGTGDLSWAVTDSNTCGQLAEYEKMLDRYYPGTSSLGICMYDANLFDDSRLNQLMESHRLALVAPGPTKRAIRIRNGQVFGDVIFDRESSGLFHYTVQRSDVNELITLGQESSLTAAMDAVESHLRALNVARA